MMDIPAPLHTVLESLMDAGYRPVIVGGSVRDALMGRPVKDYDVEVYGVGSMEILQRLLQPQGRVDAVGRHFGVLKMWFGEDEVDFSLPRTEKKTGAGHRGFAVTTDGGLSYADAARRRDFTINAIGYDVAEGMFFDPFDGQRDLKQGVLRHIDETTFVEDPLRVYRAVQFVARFGMTLADETFALCQKMVKEGRLEELPRERVWAEWRKLLLQSPRPSIGFEWMRKLGITERYFPELHALIGVPQNPEYHPEGDVWTHTMMAVDRMSEELGIRSEELRIGDKEKLRFLLAILCHDFGKATTTTLEYKEKTILYVSGLPATRYPLPSAELPAPRIRSIGHEAAGVEPARVFLERLTGDKKLIASILPLVEHHLAPAQYHRNRARDKTIRKLSLKLAPHASIRDLIVVARADYFGRGRVKVECFEAGEWLKERAEALGVLDVPPEPWIHGRDLIALGMAPSPEFGRILSGLYDAQIRGEVKDRESALRHAVWYYTNVQHT